MPSKIDVHVSILFSKASSEPPRSESPTQTIKTKSVGQVVTTAVTNSQIGLLSPVVTPYFGFTINQSTLINFSFKVLIYSLFNKKAPQKRCFLFVRPAGFAPLILWFFNADIRGCNRNNDGA